MAVTRRATTTWEGTLTDGRGQTSLDSSGLAVFDVAWQSRSGDPASTTSPEELIAAAHATCFSMALAHRLAGSGVRADQLRTSAEVDFQAGEGITGIRLHVGGEVPGIDLAELRAAAEETKTACPVSKALAAVPISLTIDEAWQG